MSFVKVLGLQVRARVCGCVNCMDVVMNFVALLLVLENVC